MTGKDSQPAAISPSISLAWTDLSVTDITHYMTLQQVPDKLGFLAKKFQLKGYQNNSRSGILLDFYFYTLSFAISKGFTAEKVSTTFSILKTVHQKSMEDSFCTLDQAFQHFKELLVKHSVSRPPFSVEVFSLEDLKKITDYATETYFRHYKLYRYSFTKKQVININIAEIRLEQPPTLPPLAEAQEITSVPLTQERRDGMLKQEAAFAQKLQETQSIQAEAAAQAAAALANFATSARTNPSLTPAATPRATPQQDPQPSKEKEVPETPMFALGAAEEAVHAAKPVEAAAPVPAEAAAPSPRDVAEALSLSQEIERLVADRTAALVQAQLKDLREDMSKQLKTHQEQLTTKITKLLESGKHGGRARQLPSTTAQV